MKITKEYKPMEGKDTTEWQELSKEMTEFFKKNMYWVPWKYPMYLIKEKFKVAKQENRSLQYFLGMLKNNAKDNN